MHLHISLIVVTALIAFSASVLAVDKRGDTGNGQPDLQTVKGQVLKHDDETLTIKDRSGKEIHLHVGKDTKIPGLPGAKFKSGDEVEATVTPDGHAASIHPAP
ncbi:MAG: hypothetical protein ICV76_06015 [Nitrospiraceae bacterium]|nr:hypothetical protein [Nitrospiraceae bacterium]